MEYLIRDTYGNYPWENSIIHTHKDLDMLKSKEYTYFACKYPNRFTNYRDDVLSIVVKLRRLNRFAEFENLDWEIVEVADIGDLDFSYMKLPLDQQYFFLNKDDDGFIYPRCHKCDKQILVPEENLWGIHGGLNYGTHYDSNEEYEIVKNLRFCDYCISEFVGSIDRYLN
jgi:hypothetical protein